MRLNPEELVSRMRTDDRFKKLLKKLIIAAVIAMVLIVVLLVAGLILFSSTIIRLVQVFAPALYELVFDYARGFVAPFMLQDLTALLQPITENAAEMKTLVNTYFEQLATNPAIDFQNFQNFISTVKNSLLDNQITNAELELVRGLLSN